MASKDEIVIEMGRRGCGDVEFPPAMLILRGRFSQAELGPVNQGFCRKVPTVPGMRVALDIVGRKARIFDPLALPEFKETMDDVSTLLKTQAGAVVNQMEPKPNKEQYWENMNDVDIASWHHWMKRLVEQDHTAILRQGHFLDQAKIPGRVKLDFLADPRGGPTFQDEFQKMQEGTYIWPGQPGFAEQQQELREASATA